MTTLGGQVALVTGASRGIGRAIATALAADGAGVALLARNAAELADLEREIADAGGAAAAFPADVTDGAALSAAVAEAESQLGPPTLLVNNAGTAAAIGPVWEVDPDVWWRDVQTTVLGSFLAARAVLPGMRARRGGRIVNVSSYVGIRPSPYLSAYGAAKAALVNLTESLAAEVGDDGVAVFALSPGHVRTDLVRNLIESEEGQRWIPHVAESEPVELEQVAQLVCALATGRYDPLAGTFLHVLDDVDGLLTRADEVVAEERFVPRLRR
jgi:NAD(P)-dependent dehydrogenase (short-subunit alcohol dehydrogenase family)